MAKTKKQTKTEKVAKIRKKLQGIVISDVNQNSVRVKVETKFAHPLYKKIVATHKTYLVHTEDESIKIGDKVIIEEGKPVSKRKSFYLIEKLDK